MSRYIKTDALMEDVGSLYRDEDHTDYNVAIADALDVIDEQPTADVVEVVRCEECIWRDVDPFDEHTTGCRWYQEERPNDDDYCSYGERREE